MTDSRYLHFYESLVRTPTAPFREQWSMATLDRLLGEIPGLTIRRDRWGNTITRLQRGAAPVRDVAYVAHLDHPGFYFPEANGAVSTGEPLHYRAIFEGGVEESYFMNAAVRVFRSAADPGVAARIVAVEPFDAEADHRVVTLRTEEPVDGALLAMWDVTVFAVEGTTVQGRVCDDLNGCAILLEALRRLAEQPNIDITVVFTRAEEAGFCGTMCLLDDAPFAPPLPLDPFFVSIETSGETAVAKMGEGAVIRLGDKATTFDSKQVEDFWLLARTHQLGAKRALMDRGTCEATPFSRAGYRAGGLSTPVRHYHNMDRESKVLAAEQVSLLDVEALIDVIVRYQRGEAAAIREAMQPGLNYDLFLRKGRALLG